MSHYFTYFPQMLYDAVQDGTTSPVLVTNILKRVKGKRRYQKWCCFIW